MNLFRLLTKLVAERSGTIFKWTARVAAQVNDTCSTLQNDLSMSENIGFTNTDPK